MSDLQDLIARSSVLSYQQGRKDERINLLSLARDASVENDIGRYVYLSDLNDYIEEWDRGQSEKRNSQED
jgi:hypothetical protein